MLIKQKALKLFILVVSAVFILLSCSNSTTTSDSETGSIAFNIEWPSDVPRRAQALESPIDCDAADIATISVSVYNANGVRVKEVSFLCSVGEGTVSDIEPGSSIDVYIYARDGAGINLYEVIVTGITISPGVITDIGAVELEEVDPEADSDGDGVNDDQDLCSNTPIGIEVDTDGCAETYTHSSSEMTFIHISSGTFTMGSPDGEPRESETYDADETQHQVTLTQSFYMQTTEVTQAQWTAVMGTNPSNNSDCANCPVERVSWSDIQSFITTLNNEGESTYSLPTESQWEYAARAGTTTAFPNGDITEYANMVECNYDANLDAIGWYCDNSNSTTHEVAQKDPNAWRLYDMHGNVWEWCRDWYGIYPSTSVTDPNGSATGSDRVVRGGSCNGFAASARSADRWGHDPDSPAIVIGFRLVVQP